jgi:hypothetical protein
VLCTNRINLIMVSIDNVLCYNCWLRGYNDDK